LKVDETASALLINKKPVLSPLRSRLRNFSQEENDLLNLTKHNSLDNAEPAQFQHNQKSSQDVVVRRSSTTDKSRIGGGSSVAQMLERKRLANLGQKKTNKPP